MHTSVLRLDGVPGVSAVAPGHIMVHLSTHGWQGRDSQCNTQLCCHIHGLPCHWEVLAYA